MSSVAITRRTWLGSLATACLGADRLPFGIDGLAAAPAKPEPPHNAIVIFLAGGMSHLDSLDPKPNAPFTIRGPWQAIDSSTPGVQLVEHLPRLAGLSQHFTLLRHLSHQQGDHRLAERQMLSGEPFTSADTPSLGAIVSSQVGWQIPPAFAAVPRHRSDAGVLGTGHDAFNTLGDAGDLLKQTSPMAIRPARRRLLTLIDDSGPRGLVPSPDGQARDQAYDRSLKLLGSRSLRHTLDLSRESAQSRAKYGDTALGRHLLLARRLVEAGSRFVLVPSPGWDTHRDNFSTMASLLPPLDQGLSALLRDLDDRGRLGQTIVLLVTEFGRTPLVNRRAGRDHWPRAMSALWAAGQRRERVLGRTDKTGGAPVGDSISPADLAVTLLTHLGIDWRNITLPPGGRLLLPDAAPIHPLTNRDPVTRPLQPGTQQPDPRTDNRTTE